MFKESHLYRWKKIHRNTIRNFRGYRSRKSEILTGKRKLNLTMSRKLNEILHIPADVLILYKPILEIFSNYICKTGDTLVIKQLVETVSVDGIMESETRDLAMGEAFICKSDLFINALNSMDSKDDRFYVSFHIGFGLLQYYQIKEKQLLPKDPMYLKLNEKLNAVEKASMPSK